MTKLTIPGLMLCKSLFEWSDAELSRSGLFTPLRSEYEMYRVTLDPGDGERSPFENEFLSAPAVTAERLGLFLLSYFAFSMLLFKSASLRKLDLCNNLALSGFSGVGGGTRPLPLVAAAGDWAGDRGGVLTDWAVVCPSDIFSCFSTVYVNEE